ncbi:hypothetical protein UT300012_23200 [Paraclostridium bifermentans]
MELNRGNSRRKIWKQKPKLNKYEKQMMLNLYVLRGIYILLVLVNLVLPIFSKSLGFQDIFQWIIIGVHTKGQLNAWGFFTQKVPTLSVGFLRIGQIAFHSFIGSNHINWSFYIIVLLVDFAYLFLMFIDASSYEYRKDEE